MLLKVNSKKYLLIITAGIVCCAGIQVMPAWARQEKKTVSEVSGLVSKSKDIYYEGRQLYDKGEYIKAKLKFEEALDVYADNEEAKTYLFLSKLNLSRMGMSAAELEERENSARDELASKAIYKEGERLFSEGDYIGAKMKFEEYMKKRPNNMKADEYLSKIDKELARKEAELKKMMESEDLFTKGAELYDKEEYEQALMHFKKALAINPDNFKAEDYLNRTIENIERKKKEAVLKVKSQSVYADGLVKFNMGDFSGAITKFEEALSIYDGNNDARVYLEKSREEIRKREEAAKRRAEAVKVLQEGLGLFNKGNWSGSLTYFEKALALDPENSEATLYADRAKAEIQAEAAERMRIAKSNEAYEEGIKLFRKKDYEKARARFQEAVAINKDNDDAKEYLLKSKNEIAEIAAQAKKKEDIDRLYKQGLDLLSGNDIDKAKSAFESVLDLDSSDANARKMLDKTLEMIAKRQEDAARKAEAENEFKAGVGFYTSGNYDDALKRFKTVMELAPAYPGAADYINKCEDKIKEELIRQKEKEQARRIFEEGMKYYNNADYEKAAMRFEGALKLDPDNVDAKSYKEITAVEIKKKKEEAAQKLKAQELFKEGVRLYDSEEYDKAKEVLEHAVKLDPDHAEAKKYFDKTLEGIQFKQEEARDRAKAIDLYESGTALWKQGELKRAQDAFKECLDLFPGEKTIEGYVKKLDEEIKAKEEYDKKKAKINDILAESRGWYSKGDHLKARSVAEKALKIDPKDRDAQALMDMINTTIDEAKAEKERQAEEEKALKEAGKVFKKGDYEKAKDMFNAVLEKNADNAEAKEYVEKCDAAIKEAREKSKKEEKIKRLNGQGDKAFKSNDLEKARIIFEEVLALDPEDGTAKQALGMIKKREDEAKAREKARKEAETAYEEGVKLFTAGDFANAEGFFQDALKKDPDFVNAKLYLEKTKVEMQKAKAKAENLRKSRKLFEEAMKYYSRNEYEKANIRFKEASRLSPENVEIKAYLEITEKELSKNAEAKKMKIKAQALADEAVKDYDNGEYDKAAAGAENALKLDADNKDAKNIFNRAVEAARRAEAEKEQKDKARGKYDEGMELWGKGDLEGAMAALTEAVRLNPENDMSRVQVKKLGEEMKGREKEARQKEEDLKKTFSEAVKKFSTQEYKSAKAMFEEVSAADPANNEARGYIVKCQDAIEAAEKDAQRIAKIKELLENALNVYKTGDLEGAMAGFNGVLKIDKENQTALEYVNRIGDEIRQKQEDEKNKIKIQTLFNEGVKYYDDGNYDSARKKFEELIDLKPNHGAAREYMAHIAEKIEEKEIKAKFERSDKLYKEGLELYNKGDLSGAEAKFNESINANPDNKEAIEYLRRVNEEAMKQKEEERNKERSKDLYEQGKKFYMDQEYQSAIAKFKESLVYNPSNELSKTFLDKSIEYLEEQKDKKEAEKRSEKAYKEGLSYFKKKDFDSAADKFEQAIKYNADNKEAAAYLEKSKDGIASIAQAKRMKTAYNEGVAFYNNGNLEEARARFEEVLKYDRDNTGARDYLAMAVSGIDKRRMEAEKPVKAEQPPDPEGPVKVAKAAKNDAAAKKQEELYQKALAYYKEGDYEKAKASFNNIATAEAYDDKTKKEVARMMKDIEAREAAQKKEKAVQDKLEKGIASFNSGDYEGAASILSEVLKEDRGNKDAKKYLAGANEALKKKAKEAENEERAKMLFSAGVQNFDKGRYSKSKRSFTEYLKIKPGDQKASEYLDKIDQAGIKASADKPQVVFNKAVAYFNKGRLDTARKSFEAYLKVKPDSAEAKDYLSRIDEKEKAASAAAALADSLKKSYKEGVNLYNKGDYVAARTSFEGIVKQNPEYMDCAARIKKLDVIIKEKASEIENRNKAKEVFAAGMGLFEKGDYENAAVKFTEALDLSPRFNPAKAYLKKARKKILDQKIQKAHLQGKLEKKAWGLLGLKEKGVRDFIEGYVDNNVPANALTIDDCVKISLKNSLQLETADKQLKLANMKVLQAKRNLGPSLKAKWEESSGRVGGRMYEGRKLLGEYNQPIYHGGELIYSIGQENVNLEIVKNDYERIKNEVTLQVEKAYYNLDKTNKLVDIQKGIFDKADEITTQVKKAYEGEAISKLEYLNVSSKFNQINFQYISAQEDLLLAKLILQQAMNVDPDQDIQITPLPAPEVREDINLDQCFSLAFANRPDMKIGFLMVEYYMYEKRIMKAHGMPKVDFMGSWGYSFEDYVPQDNEEGHLSHKFLPEWYAGVKVSLPFGGSTAGYSYTKETWQPVVSSVHGTESVTHTMSLGILDNLKFYTDLNEAEVGLSKAQYEYTKTKQEATVEVQESFFKYKKSILQLQVAKSKMEYQTRQLDLMEIRRQMNQEPASSLLEELVRFGEEKFGMLQSIADYYIAIKSLNKAIGILGYF